VVGGRRSVPNWKVYGAGIVLSALYDSIESHKHWVSNDLNSKDISKFERLNAVSMYDIENKQVVPLRLTDNKKEKHINLLYLQDSHNDNLGHFAWIKNLSRLVSSQISGKKNKKFFCDR